MMLAACGGSGSPDGSSGAPTATDDGSCVMTERAVPNEGWSHVAEGTAIAYQSNPPASGPHYPVWARYQAYTTPVARGHWVHNVEHGAIVLLHRPDASPAVVSALESAFRALPSDTQCGHARALLTPDPLLARPVAAVAANFVLEGDCAGANAIRNFTLAHRNRAPENICDSGTRP
jgi:hypothetical protein